MKFRITNPSDSSYEEFLEMDTLAQLIMMIRFNGTIILDENCEIMLLDDYINKLKEE